MFRLVILIKWPQRSIPDYNSLPVGMELQYFKIGSTYKT